MTVVTVQIDLDEEADAYVVTSARLRRISRAQLMRKVCEFVIKDKMILGILDDEDVPSLKTSRKKGHRYRKPRGDVPESDLYSGLRSSVPDAIRSIPAAIPTRKLFVRKRYVPKTKSEMLRELQQAVLNTGGVVE